MVFKANTGNGIPLFTGKGGAITRVIGPGDTIIGYGVGGVNIGVNAINDSGQITFWYSRFGADGAVKGIAVATPTPAAPNAALTKLPNGDLQIIFSGVLQGSSDLSGWADVTPTPTSPYVIPVAQLVGKKFFRARP